MARAKSNKPSYKASKQSIAKGTKARKAKGKVLNNLPTLLGPK